MLKFYYPTFLCIFFLFIANAQTTVVLNATKDNTIYQNATSNSNGAGENFFSGNTAVSSPRRALIKFDIAAQIPAGASITSATLTLFCNKTIGSNTDISIHGLLADWGEGSSDAASNEGSGTAAATNDATWVSRFTLSSLWSSAGGDFTSTASATSVVGGSGAAYNWTSLQVTGDVQNWLNNSATNFGWILIGDETISTTTKRFASRENPTAIQRPQLSVTYTVTGPTPVLLNSFNTIPIKSGTLLKWVTAQEFNNAFFLIEHSADGTSFLPVGKVTGTGNAQGLTSYQFRHEGISAGRHFYRLAQTDINGKITYSDIKTVIISKRSFSIQISPNPVADKITLQSSVNRTGIHYTIISSTGKLVLSGVLNNKGIEVKRLTPGGYYLKIQEQDGSVFSGTFLKN
ncbi:MAG: DNRLRE domain-containing protein [Ginsengibacter sp.]